MLYHWLMPLQMLNFGDCPGGEIYNFRDAFKMYVSFFFMSKINLVTTYNLITSLALERIQKYP